MSPRPDRSSAAIVARIIADTFEVSDADAQTNAESVIALAEGWGGSAAAGADWPTIVRKHFGERLKWRSEVDRLKFIEEKKVIFAAYESYIRARK